MVSPLKKINELRYPGKVLNSGEFDPEQLAEARITLIRYFSNMLYKYNTASAKYERSVSWEDFSKQCADGVKSLFDKILSYKRLDVKAQKIYLRAFMEILRDYPIKEGEEQASANEKLAFLNENLPEDCDVNTFYEMLEKEGCGLKFHTANYDFPKLDKFVKDLEQCKLENNTELAKAKMQEVIDKYPFGNFGLFVVQYKEQHKDAFENNKTNEASFGNL